jgi:hypothetical protein
MSRSLRSSLATILLAAPVLVAGCNDSTSPRDHSPPAAPRGFHSITGDGEVLLRWLGNTEFDVAGYHVYQSSCASGPGCPYDRIGSTTGTEFTVGGLTNGVTRYFAVAAFDRAGNESPLSYEDVFDTPRPEGFDLGLDNYAVEPATSGYDFSAYAVRPFDDARTDLYFGSRDGVHLMIAPFTDTEIQDAGYASSLDAVDFAPTAGWSPSGTAELVVGHCYVVLTHDGLDEHYAKFRVTSLSPDRVVVDWAYQVDPGNRELKARPLRPSVPRVRRAGPWGA